MVLPAPLSPTRTLIRPAGNFQVVDVEDALAAVGEANVVEGQAQGASGYGRGCRAGRAVFGAVPVLAFACAHAPDRALRPLRGPAVGGVSGVLVRPVTCTGRGRGVQAAQPQGAALVLVQGEEVFPGEASGDPTVLHQEHLVGDAAQEVETVLGHDEGVPGGSQASQEFPELLDGGGREVGGRLVEEQDRGVPGQGLGAGDLLQFTTRQAGEVAVEQSGDPHLPGRRGGPREDVRGVETVVLTAEGEFADDVGGEELRTGVWKTVAVVRPASVMSVPGTSTPATSTLPSRCPAWKWGTRPLSSRSAVDFPDPEAPHRRVSVPWGISRSMWSRQGEPGVLSGSSGSWVRSLSGVCAVPSRAATPRPVGVPASARVSGSAGVSTGRTAAGVGVLPDAARAQGPGSVAVVRPGTGPAGEAPDVASAGEAFTPVPPIRTGAAR